MHTGLERLANLPGFTRGRLAREGRGEVVVTDAGGPDLSRSVSSNPHENSETAHRNRLSCGDRSSHTVRQPGAEAVRSQAPESSTEGAGTEVQVRTPDPSRETPSTLSLLEERKGGWGGEWRTARP